MAATKTNIQKRAMLSALVKSLGIVTAATKKVGIDRCTHYKWMNTDKEYKQAVEDIADVAIDFVEDKLMQSIRKGSDTATIFYLKCKAKTRGYIEKNEIGITDKEGNDVPITGMKVI